MVLTPVYGWGGYITTTTQASTILNYLSTHHQTGLRYWAFPPWLSGGTKRNLTVLDYLVSGALARGIRVYIDCEHNFPPSAYITGKETSWINDLITIGKRYNNYSNAVLECNNEYTGSDQVALFNRCIAKLRAAGVTMHLLFNFWWNVNSKKLIDPLNKYAVGRHIYGPDRLDAYTGVGSSTLSSICSAYSIKTSGYFTGTTQYAAGAKSLGIPDGFVWGEMGPTDKESMVDLPTVPSMAFAMRFLRDAMIYKNASVICYRCGSNDKRETYQTRAKTYLGTNYFPSGYY